MLACLSILFDIIRTMIVGNSLKTLSISQQDRVLLVYPHPDDETYCNAGLIQKLIKNNVHTKVLCLTKGGASTLAFAVKDGEVLTNVRTQEFEGVMNFLGVKDFEIHNFEDGNLSSENQNVCRTINEEIDKDTPTILVTYEPLGIYGHKDHIIVSKITGEIAKERGIKLIYSTVAPKYKSSASSLDMADDPKRIIPIEPTVKLRLSLLEFISKLKALTMYRSQISAKHETGHKIYQALQMLNEYYHTCY
jgi:LmbE family N-acetylglucosaminyl deacetylase